VFPVRYELDFYLLGEIQSLNGYMFLRKIEWNLEIITHKPIIFLDFYGLIEMQMITWDMSEPS
jgi:hypothetical protein